MEAQDSATAVRREEIRIERIQGWAAFRELRQSWNSLLQESAADTVFLTWEWLYSWFKFLRRDEQLAILRLTCAGETIGFVPLTLHGRFARRAFGIQQSAFLGMRGAGADYLDAIIRPGWEECALAALVSFTEDRRLLVRVARAKVEGSFVAQWFGLLKERGWPVSITANEICPYISLAGRSWESYLESTGRQHRETVRRKLKTLSEKFDVRFERVSSEAQRRQALPLMIDMHNLRWEHRGGSSAFPTAHVIAFHDEFTRLALECGWLRLFTLRLNGRPAASLYGLRYRRVFYFYQSGLDPAFAKYSVGLAAMALAIKSAIEEGAEEYDLLHGDEPYKFHWASSVRHIGHFLISPPGAAGLMYQRASNLDRQARRFARRTLPANWGDSISSGLRAWHRWKDEDHQ